MSTELVKSCKLENADVHGGLGGIRVQLYVNQEPAILLVDIYIYVYITYIHT